MSQSCHMFLFPSASVCLFNPYYWYSRRNLPHSGFPCFLTILSYGTPSKYAKTLILSFSRSFLLSVLNCVKFIFVHDFLSDYTKQRLLISCRVSSGSDVLIKTSSFTMRSLDIAVVGSHLYSYHLPDVLVQKSMWITYPGSFGVCQNQVSEVRFSIKNSIRKHTAGIEKQLSTVWTLQCSNENDKRQMYAKT